MDTVNRGPAGSDVALLIGRVLMALIFIPSGYGKLMGLTQFAGNLTNMGVPADYAYWVAVAAGGVEFFGAICILLGLATRYVAILLAVFTLIAALLAHRYWTFTDAAQILYAAGGGRWSIDRRGA